ncbi:MAG: carboxypeptidase regulatory-like domain-containing protein [Acidobacteria bacterium]|nr:carboxypeptidase regulatory-like domain-containing protein [Acidobacteriota bacterium]
MKTLLKCAAVFAVLLILGTAAIWAQDKDDKRREATLRTVRGETVDKDENFIEGAVVHLKNLKSTIVVTHISDKDGKFRFSGLDPNIDYEVHAETEDRMSNKRTISSFDSRKEFVVHLKLDKKKESK